MTATMSEEPVGPASDSGPAKPPSLLLNRDYVGWWIGNTVSDFGSALSLIAYPLLILAATGSASKAGLVASANEMRIVRPTN